MRKINWGSWFVLTEGAVWPTTTPKDSTLTVGVMFRLGTWWEMRNGEIVGEMEGVNYPDCINWECFSDE